MYHIVQVDHIGIQSENPRVLFDFFSKTLGLPVVFDYTQYPNYTSGSVSLGNMYLELMRFAAPKPTEQINARYIILGFLVEAGKMSDSLQQLDREGILHSAVMPFFSPDATDENPIRLWDNVYLGEILGHNFWRKQFINMSQNMEPKPSIQKSLILSAIAIRLLSMSFDKGMPVLTQYHQHVDTHTSAIDGSLLSAANGGRLRVQGVHEIVIGADSENELTVWEKLLGSDSLNSNGGYSLPRGPQIRIVNSGNSRIQMLVLKVESLQHILNVAQLEPLNIQETNTGIYLAIPGGVTVQFVD